MPKNLINLLLFQVGWFACVLGGTSLWLLVAAGVLLVHLLWTSSWRSEGDLIISVTLIGTLVDSLLLACNVFDFDAGGPVIPLWLVVLWALLATTLNHGLAWTAKPLWRACLLGAVCGPLSYYAGSELAGVRLPLGLWPSMLLLAVIWAMLFPMLLYVADYFRLQTEHRLH
ncbi:DUF2878 domain-containing protein [Pseudomonas sp. NA-150]|uniref:DUF2878 domain-containing protein n=1 Tax=Pseudomonas sp. NA-150 TaxID=3367525 RepID=UPI0037CBB567